ncbi:hypothetical protein ABH922_002869 [Rhodococcus sp. 27YEA15]|uniref:hypothetical protein n=1 Tax=Rhodococcus sp. 27YEA15 TaxID=3156259 RepID=UPI003C7A3972
MKYQNRRVRSLAATIAVAGFAVFAVTTPATATPVTATDGESTSASPTLAQPTNTAEARATLTPSSTPTAAATTARPTSTPRSDTWTTPDDGTAAGERQYSVSPGLVTVYYPAGQSANQGDHVNLTIRNPETGTTMHLGTHIDGNGQWTEKYIGTSPWVLDIASHPDFPGWSAFEVTWVQVHGQNYHYGEHGEQPMSSRQSDFENPYATTTPATYPAPVTTTPVTTTPVTTTPVTTTPVTTTPVTTTPVTTTPVTTTPVTTTPVTTTPATTTPSIPTTTGTKITTTPVAIPIVDVPRIDSDTPAPTIGPEGEPVYVTETPEGYLVHGYDNPHGTFVPLAYDDALVFQTGKNESNGPSSAVIAGIGSATLIALITGTFVLRRRRDTRAH